MDLKEGVMKKFLVVLIGFLPIIASDVKKFKIPRINKPPKIDGVIDNIYYKNFLKLDDFQQVEPKYNEPPTQKTEFFIAHDSDYLYIAFKAYDNKPSQIRASISRRDQLQNDDLVGIIIDPFHTQLRAFIFIMNPLGIQAEGIRDDSSHRRQEDFSWDTIWYSKGKLYPWGYFVEAKIPFKSLRFPAEGKTHQWGFHAFRKIPRNSELDSLIHIDRKIRGMINQAGTLIIEDNIKPGLHLELIPSITGLKNEEQSFKPEFGFSFKDSLTSDITLDFAYNPDFSQIESDEGKIDVNQRYALYYSEKRPFFLEAAEIFKTPIQVFYSRRIAKPKFGAKITGRYGRSGFGFITAYDTASFESLWDVSEGGEDNAYVNIARYKYEVWNGSFLGLTLTDKRWGNGYYNTVGGIDGYLRKGNFIISFQGLASTTAKEKKINGSAFQGEFSYGEEHFNFLVGTKLISPDFDAQEGFIKRTDMRSYYSWTGYTFYPEKKFFLNGGPSVFLNYITDWKGEKTDQSARFSFRVRFTGDSSLNIFYSNSFEKYNENGFNKNTVGFFFNSSPTKYLSFGGGGRVGDGIYYSDDPFLGFDISGHLYTTLLPLNRLSIQASYVFDYFYEQRDGNLVYKMNIFRNKTVFLFNREFSLRAIWEYNDYYEKFYASLLLAYEYSPGTVFYLGASSDFYRQENSWDGQNFSVFVKFSYLFRI